MARNLKSKYGRSVDRLNAVTDLLQPNVKNVRFTHWLGGAVDSVWFIGD